VDGSPWFSKLPEPLLTPSQNAPSFAFVIAFEVWNRHKYPIIVDEVLVTFKEHEFVDPLESKPDSDINWSRDGKTFECFNQIALDQSENQMYNLIAPSQDTCRISVRYFDPIKDKYRKVQSATVRWASR
jgi:hypothetical protein